MKILVVANEYTNDTFQNAKGWVIDDEGRLHIVKPAGGNAASYDRGHWMSVHEGEPDPTQ